MNQPCLPVSRRRKREEEDDKMSFENVEMMDAMEYLAAVVKEAEALPEFLTSSSVSPASNKGYDVRASHSDQVPIEGSAASLRYLISARTSIVPPPSRFHCPPVEWVHGTLANFSSLRQYIQECGEKGVGGKETDRVPVPAMKDQAGWLSFCDQHPPRVQLLLQMDQVMVRRVLEHFAETAESPELSEQVTSWIYGLLARLERPLHGDDAATLYGMLKGLTFSRSKLELPSDHQELARLNILIALIGLYFEQGGGFHNLFEC
jgi:hypothetical protein